MLGFDGGVRGKSEADGRMHRRTWTSRAKASNSLAPAPWAARACSGKQPVGHPEEERVKREERWDDGADLALPEASF